MRWTDRQRALLKAMGLHLWAPRLPPPAAEPVAEPVAEPAAEPAARLAAQPALARPPRAAKALCPPAQAETASAAKGSGAADAAIAALDWPALRAAVAGCTRCALCRSRKNTVFGVGCEQAHWMIVGEAPGEQEDQHGEPFVGAAGQLLDAMLRALGLTRQAAAPETQVFIANTLKCRPPRNRNPAPEELALCEPYLHRQIALVRPKIILAMGRFAIGQLLRSDEPVGRLRGRVHRFGDIAVVVSYHPAYLLRQPMEKAKAWDDLQLAAATYARVLAGEGQ